MLKFAHPLSRDAHRASSLFSAVSGVNPECERDTYRPDSSHGLDRCGSSVIAGNYEPEA